DPANGGAGPIGVIGTGHCGVETAADDHAAVEVGVCTDPAVDDGDADTSAGQRRQPAAPCRDGIDNGRIGGGEGGRVEGGVGQVDRGVVDDALNICPR